MTGHDYGFALIEFITIVRQNGRQYGILQALCTTDLANPSLSSKRAKNEYVLTRVAAGQGQGPRVRAGMSLEGRVRAQMSR